MRTIGSVYGSLGLFTTGRPILENALEEARRVHGPDHEETAETEIELASLTQDLGDVEGAEPLFRHGLEVFRRVYGPGPDVPSGNR